MTDHHDALEESKTVKKLREKLNESHQLHSLTEDPLLKAVMIERLRASVTRALWFFLAVGSGFTTTGVQDFLAGHLNPSNPVWWGCWAVEPFMVGLLITVLRWEAAMLAESIDIDSKAVVWLKRVLLGSTLVMNLVPAIWPRTGQFSEGMLFAHFIVPVLVFFVAEVMPVIQAKCAEAIAQVHAKAAQTAQGASRPTGQTTPRATTPAPAPAPNNHVSGSLPADLVEAGRFKVDHHRTVTGETLTAVELAKRLEVETPIAAEVLALVTEPHRPINRVNGSAAATGAA